MANGKLTPKQLRFVEAYVGPARANATEAARLAGYKGNDVTLAAVGHENLRKPQVAEAVKERLEQTLGEFAADDVIRHVSNIAFSPKERTGDRLRGLELLGKYHALWTEVHAVRDLPRDPARLREIIEVEVVRVLGEEAILRLADRIRNRRALPAPTPLGVAGSAESLTAQADQLR